MSNSNKQRLTIKLQVEWGTGPLWVSRGADDFPDSYDTEEIGDIVPLSDGLRREIAAWGDRFQVTLNQDYPPDSGFAAPAEEATFIAEGRELARRMKAELPADVVVEYVPLHSNQREIISDSA